MAEIVKVDQRPLFHLSPRLRLGNPLNYPSPPEGVAKVTVREVSAGGIDDVFE